MLDTYLCLVTLLGRYRNDDLFSSIFKKKVCMCVCVCVCVCFPQQQCFFCLCHNRIEKFRRPGNFFPSREKNFLVCSSFGLGRLSSFLGGMGGGKEVNEGQHLPCCFYLCLLLDTLCVVRNLYVNLLVSR